MTEAAEHLRDWALLLRAPGSTAALQRALRAAGSPAALRHARPGQWREWELGPATCAHLAQGPGSQIEADLAWLAANGATLVNCLEARWPAALDQLPDPPVALYLLGDPAALCELQIAVVGSRSPTAAGRRIAAQLAADLSRAGYLITSGLALGVDAAAHEAALDAGGRTLAVLGTGLDSCYPACNAGLAARIVRDGALVSEFPPATPPRGHHFPRRNRLIAALTRGTVVVEAALRSGSLITARRALDLGREVFAVPGSPLNPQAAGCLELLREGAALTRCASDILSEPTMNSHKSHDYHYVGISTPPSGPPARLDKDYEILLDALGFEPASIEDLVHRTGLAAGVVASMMLILELQGRVETRPGALFNRVD
ncbi:MAG: DNA-processing protein DprA [Steroidobacteraceae bacterium]